MSQKEDCLLYKLTVPAAAWWNRFWHELNISTVFMHRCYFYFVTIVEFWITNIYSNVRFLYYIVAHHQYYPSHNLSPSCWGSFYWVLYEVLNLFLHKYFHTYPYYFSIPFPIESFHIKAILLIADYKLGIQLEW